jgi:hypothetical protein
MSIRMDQHRGTMTERQRFTATLRGDDADRFPFFDLEPYDDTVARWRREGLPKRTSVAEHFHLETHHSVGLVLRSKPFYGEASDLLTDTQAFDRRYDPGDADRYASSFESRTEGLHRDGRVVYVDASGGGILQMLGVGDWDSLVEACTALIRRPRDVEALMERTTDFYCQCLERVLSKVSVDYASLYEPIASNAGPVVSPAMFERFAMPGYRRVLGLLDRHGVTLKVFCTTGGDLGSLMPPLVDTGINVLWISNIMSPSMEYSRLRQEFGPDIGLIGGIDATALTESDDAVRRVVGETAPPLLAGGRYIPCLNDRPRENIPFARYALFRELLAELAG